MPFAVLDLVSTDVSINPLTPTLTDEIEITPELATVYDQTLFESGSYTIKKTNDLDEIIQTLNNHHDGFENNPARLYLIAHTDRDKVRKNSSLCQNDNICDNDALSKARADSVKKYLEDHWPRNLTTVKIETQAAGEECADQNASTDERQKLDRKVVFYLFFDGVKADQEYYKQLKANPCYKLNRNSSTVSEAVGETVGETNVLKKLFNNMA